MFLEAVFYQPFDFMPSAYFYKPFGKTVILCYAPQHQSVHPLVNFFISRKLLQFLSSLGGGGGGCSTFHFRVTVSRSSEVIAL